MISNSNGVQGGQVYFEMADGVAILRIENPPVNAGSYAVRQGLVGAIAKATEHQASGAIILGVGKCFVAGSDLREFGQPLKTPELPDVIRAIEDAPFPVVAALHGVALGGGLELALGCDYRIAALNTKVGLPEVSLGFVPGAGGTQRLPRLVGIAKAVDLICAASRISTRHAQEIGLIDAVSDGDILTDALAFLKSQTRSKRLAISQPVPADAEGAIDAATAKAIKRGKGRPNVTEAIRLVKAATGDAVQTLADERAVFQEMRLSEDAFALRHLFFAERSAATVDDVDPKLAGDVTTVGVIGGGTMGQGIARACLNAGLKVTVVEQNDEALAKSTSAIAQNFTAQVERGKRSVEQVNALLNALTGALELEKVAKCDLVIEAVFEDLDVKIELLAKLETVLAKNAIIATNTSYLNINEMVRQLSRPERVIGLHFFSPADVMKLLEIVRTDRTSDAVLATGLKLARRLGKQPVVAGVGEGFIGNRIYAAYRRRAELLVLDGATPQDVDAAITQFGFAMGPFAVSDMSGLDIAWAMRKRKASERSPEARYVTIPDSLCEAGRLGRKTGKGWYDYSNKTPEPDPVVEAIIAEARTEAGIAPQTYDTETIQRQLLAAMINEAALLLSEGIAKHPSDVDVTLTNGYGFPRWRGGPIYWAATQDRAKVRADIADLEIAIGQGFRTGPLDETLDQIDTPQKV
ncbi:3-hydroxyacyl-CoA dehydrogenase NAD-binding domain-containing protein [Phaeobacter sp. C3_T13_0]|uniref:3-hydroxyacyl-CoA dehydrogenase NAD-binding domain-containing protein n=1 Tax=Phaeobacter cretensis TaxID=3342641 RepID=UPI0039BCCAB0